MKIPTTYDELVLPASFLPIPASTLPPTSKSEWDQRIVGSSRRMDRPRPVFVPTSSYVPSRAVFVYLTCIDIGKKKTNLSRVFAHSTRDT